MTRDDILRFAYLSKITNPDDGQIKFGQPTAKCLEQFANLVAAAEREACAKVCEELESQRINSSSLSGMVFGSSAEDCAAAIRARGNG